MTKPILFEDDSLLVIDKPYGVVVNRAESVKDETVQEWAKKRLEVSRVPRVPQVSREEKIPSLKLRGGEGQLLSEDNRQPSVDDFYNRAGVVHRLDKETSGCLIIAKTPTSFVKLQQAFKERRVHKTYMALIHGKLVPETGQINAPIGRLPWNRERFGVVPGGKEALTKYKVDNYYKSYNKSEIFTLVHLFPETGRTHQLRVHLKYLGFPIVGDYLYAGRKQQRDDRLWCPRVFLHAAQIEFPHPATGNVITVETPLPEELQVVLLLFIASKKDKSTKK